MTEKIIPDGYKLVAVKGLDELVYWLERCKDKGHLENCADLIEPFEAFEYRNVSEESVIAAHETKAAPAVPQGWTIRHIDGGISVTHKDGSGAFVRETENSERIIPAEILYRLCSDLIAVAPQPEPAVPQSLQPIETIKYWADAYSDRSSGPHFQGHGMVVTMLREYEQLRTILAATPAAPSQPVTLTDEEIKRNWSGGACPPWGIKFARAIIAALREKEQAT